MFLSLSECYVNLKLFMNSAQIIYFGAYNCQAPLLGMYYFDQQSDHSVNVVLAATKIKFCLSAVTTL